jgi:hypothetical protein
MDDYARQLAREKPVVPHRAERGFQEEQEEAQLSV